MSIADLCVRALLWRGQLVRVASQDAAWQGGGNAHAVLCLAAAVEAVACLDVILRRARGIVEALFVTVLCVWVLLW